MPTIPRTSQWRGALLSTGIFFLCICRYSYMYFFYTLLSKILNFCSPFSTGNSVSHPYITRGKATVLCTVIGIATTRVQTERPRTASSILVRGKKYISFLKRPDWLWGPPSLLSNFDLPRGLSSRNVKLTSHFHLEPRLKINGYIPPLLHTLS